MQTILLAGAGSVGKTLTMNAILDLCARRKISMVKHSSTTRQSYADAGFTAESDALKDPEVNMRFQYTVMDDNTEALRRSLIDAHHSRSILVADRSPFDYASYWTSVFSDRMTLAGLADRRRSADKVMQMTLAMSDTVHLFMLPYPAPWSKDTESSDGWRADTTGKNLSWSTQCEWMIRTSNVKSSRFKVYELPAFVNKGSPEERAMHILSTVL